MTLPREMLAIARLDLAEALRSRWILFCVGVYALLGGAFIFVGLRESTLLGFTGMGRVLLSLCHALLLVLPLLALTATGQVVNRAREDGTLELLFSHPLRRVAWLGSVALTRYAVLVVPLVALMLVMAVAGRLAFGEAVAWGFLLQSVALSAALLFAFVGVGMAISTLVRHPARATVWLLLSWAASAALLDFGLVGLMLRFRLNPQTVFLLASLNPVQSARVALLSGASNELSVLGPVGFFLANRVGHPALLAVGILWPLLVGALALGVALRSFRRGDIV